MTKERITFVEPRAVAENIYTYHTSFPLMGPMYLGTLLKKKGYDVRIFSENMLGTNVPKEFLDTDILCLSLITPAAPRGYQIARAFRDMNPHGRIIAGGIHPSFLPQEALEVSDVVVCGEGENIIADIIQNGAFGSGDKIVHGTPVRDLDSLPIPDWGLLYGYDRIKVQPIMTSRGCPYDCHFCTVTQMFGRQFRMTSPERVLEEIRLTSHKRVFFYDDNLGANRKRLHTILDGMISQGVKKAWYAQLRANVAKDEGLVEKMGISGCRHALFGFESMDNTSLREYNKKQTREEIEHCVRTFHKNGIGVHGMFVFGADHERPDMFKNTLRFCRDVRLDTAQFAALTPFPGTRVYKRFEEEKRILHKRWEFYDGMHVVFAPLKMTAAELQRGVIESFDEFYSYMNIGGDALDTAMFSLFSLFTKKLLPGVKDAIVRLAIRSAFVRWRKATASYIDYIESAVAGPEGPLA